jgi:hypothetical protein
MRPAQWTAHTPGQLRTLTSPERRGWGRTGQERGRGLEHRAGPLGLPGGASAKGAEHKARRARSRAASTGEVKTEDRAIPARPPSSTQFPHPYPCRP